MSHTKTAVFNELVRPCSFFEVRNPDQYDSFVKNIIRGVYFLLQKVFEGEFIHVIAYAENFYFTTYSSNEFSVQIR